MLNYCLLFCVLINAMVFASDANWKFKWFPYAPNSVDSKQMKEAFAKHSFYTPDNCDSGQLIGIDYDPNDKRNTYNYLCLGNRTRYEPNLNREALYMEHYVAPMYVPPVKCLNESITYEEKLPTIGAFRPLAPKYGTYKYLPPQRWLHSLADGAIVLLYHPCAFSGQVSELQNLLRGCLYRHIVTPSQELSPERPLALLAWGKCLQMSVVDSKIVGDFIRQHAKQGPLAMQKYREQDVKNYDVELLAEAHLVTDIDDSIVCGFMEM